MNNNLYFKELYARYYKKIKLLCSSHIPHSEVDDAIQEIFIKVLDKANTFRKESQVSTRIYSIAKNYCLDSIRKNNTHKTRVKSILYTRIVDPDKIESQKEKDEKLTKFLDYISELNMYDRNLLKMKYFKNLKVDDIANILDKKPENVKMQIARIKKKLKKVLEKRGIKL